MIAQWLHAKLRYFVTKGTLSLCIFMIFIYIYINEWSIALVVLLDVKSKWPSLLPLIETSSNQRCMCVFHFFPL